ncbi:Bidirectional sugar transporter NEC1, partial [Mucuna pruriens]
MVDAHIVLLIPHKRQSLFPQANASISKMLPFSNHEMVLIFGLLGNIVSFLVFLAPLPTFYTIYKKKTSDGFQSIPYVVALLSALLLLYYGFIKTNAILIITINCIGCVIEVAYLTMYIIYAPKKQKISTLVLILIADIGGFGLTMLITIFAVKGTTRVHTVGMFCAVFNIAVFAAPLSIMRRVIKTKSVEFMPFSLSLFLTLCATMWFFYGFFDKDYYIMLPNVLGFLFGISQMILYMIYKNVEKKVENSCTEQQEREGTVNYKQHSCDGNKLDFPSLVEMKENQLNQISRRAEKLEQ